MDWRDYIYSNPEIGFGKPIFRGTRIKVEFVLKLMSAGWSADQMAEEYPGILREHLLAAAAFAADMMQNEEYVAIGQAKAA
ncbi:MAG: hypothetical protein B7Y43_16225 [Sphingomonas sp. 28-62-20]|uniref:DUF433 domain-containing protein n=1 Tax=Sphingomonas sp. 28-62-20 TaxID=1970433 RepID=UPI000BC45C7B|nr:MAG: hypothetical protein B7Y43_16225 [Sphingomonas sp. 28-62-20]